MGDELGKFEERISYTFKDKSLLIQALTHSSSRAETRPCNERLEFLGDSILGHIVSEYLYGEFPDYEEGDLSMAKSVLVSSKTLAEIAKQLEFEEMIIVGKGIQQHKSIPMSILSNVFEAVTAAMYLDGGLEPVRNFFLPHIKVKMGEILSDKHEKNYKSLLQDYAQKTTAQVPVYSVMKEAGPDHRKMFQVAVDIGGVRYGPAWGRSKKEAEQRAARSALKTIEKKT